MNRVAETAAWRMRVDLPRAWLVRSEETPSVGGEFPDFGGKIAAHEGVLFFERDDAHAGFFGDAARRDVGDGFRDAHEGEAEDVEPEVVDGDDGLGHEAAVLPLRSEPEATIVFFAADETDVADDLAGGCLEAESPVPFFAAFDGGEGYITIEVVDTIWRVGPWDARVEILHYLPLRENALYLLGVFELKRREQEAAGFEGRGHGLDSG